MTCRGCGSRTAKGCLCSIAASDCFSRAGSGTEASPFTISPRLDADTKNLLTCGTGGLLGALPSSLANPPSCSVSRTRNQTIATNTWTALAFNLEKHDTDTMHSVSVNSSRITFTTAGVYLVTLYALWTNKDILSFFLAQILKNGVDELGFDTKRLDATSKDLFTGHTISVLESFAAGDYVEARVLQDSLGNLTIVADYGSPLFSAKRMADA